MFGSDDNNQQQPVDNASALSANMPDPINGPISPSASAVNSVFGSASGAPEVPTQDAISNPDKSTAPTNSFTAPEPKPTPTFTPITPDDNASSDIDTSDSADDLIALKQQALQQLSPLVSHLEQTPEEKFRTTMMMIQASDDQALIKSAFETAQKITDDKARAQALLDVINEINYFSQHSANSSN